VIVGVLTRDQLDQLQALIARLERYGVVDEAQSLREVVHAITNGRREVPASVAARILHVTPQTIRNWARAGILAGRQDQTGHFYVSLDELEPAVQLDLAKPELPLELDDITDEEIAAEIAAVRAERRRSATPR
jgi:predicted site-specific integrase-resolvase